MALSSIDIEERLAKYKVNGQEQGHITAAKKTAQFYLAYNDGANVDVKNFLKSLGQVDNGVIDAVVAQVNKDPQGFVQKLEKDLKNDPSAANNLKTIIENNPAEAARIINAYDGTNFKPLMASVQNSPAPATPPPVAAPQPTQSPAPAGSATTQPGSGQATSTAPAPPSTQRPHGTGGTTTPGSAAPTTSPPAAAAAGGGASSSAAVSSQQMSGLFEALKTATNSQIRGLFTGNDALGKNGHVMQFATAFAREAVKTYGISQADADGFVKRIEGDPTLQKNIADNLANNPDFIREMASLDGQNIDPRIRGLAKKKLQELMHKPEKLADPEYLKKASAMAQDAKRITQMDDWEQRIGQGLDKMGLGSFKGPLHQIFEWLKSFVMKISEGGDLKSMFSGPDGAGNMFGNLMKGLGLSGGAGSQGAPSYGGPQCQRYSGYTGQPYGSPQFFGGLQAFGHFGGGHNRHGGFGVGLHLSGRI